ncbi:MAG: polysaccharide biosynthesis C-terminal domain-containing protein [Clostridia bacterium]|nr:polysaccharide biosynthesis C-terminal domain-containing protein [Clostridia bacterium]
MDKYKRLASNTMIFAIGTFSSKLLTFFLTRLYTAVLSKAEYGVTDLIQQSGNLLLPLVTLGIVNAVVRFGLDKGVRKSDVFTTGLLSILGGSILLTAISPLLGGISLLSGYEWLLCLFVLMSSLRSLCAQFVRADNRVKLFAVDGILSTVTTIAFNVLYLVVLDWGIFGYIFSIVCSDALSVVFLFCTARLGRFIRVRELDRSVSKAMLKYAVPMIPNTVLWWITNVSDRYLVAHFCGEEFNGLYAAAYKIPSLIMLASGIFMDAWQISAVTEEKERDSFYSRVMSMYSSLLFLMASGIIVCTRVIPHILFDPKYYDAWRYIPLLVIAMVFTCIVNFLGSIYMVEKKSVRSLVTAAVSAVVNVLLNLWWIPLYGVNGAAAATLICYLIVFVIRLVDTRRYIRIRWDWMRLLGCTLIVLAQTVIALLQLPLWWVWELVLCAVTVILCGKSVIATVMHLLKRG